MGQKYLKSVVHWYGLLKGVELHVVISVPFDAKRNLSNCTWDWAFMLSQHSWARCADLKGKREFPLGGREGAGGEGRGGGGKWR